MAQGTEVIHLAEPTGCQRAVLQRADVAGYFLVAEVVEAGWCAASMAGQALRVAWAESHDRTTPSLSDEAISRESFYPDRI
jgi:hypothetical protein